MKYILIATLFSFVTGSYATVSCDFEQDMCGWSQNSSDVYIWKRQANSSGSGFSIPNAYEGLYYACISSNTYTHSSDYGRLSSPGVSISSITNFTFHYYNYGMYGNLSLYLKKNSELNLIWSHHSESALEGNYWASVSLLIPPADKTQFIFEGHFTSAKTYYLGLDSIVLESEKSESTTSKIHTIPSNQTTKFTTPKITTSVPTSMSSTIKSTTIAKTTLKSSTTNPTTILRTSSQTPETNSTTSPEISSQAPKTNSTTSPKTSPESSTQTSKTNSTTSPKTSPEISSQTPKTNSTTSPEISTQTPTTPPPSQKPTPEFSSQGPQTNLTSSPETSSKMSSPTSKLTTLSHPSTTPDGISPLQSSSSLTLLSFLITLVCTLIIV